MGDLKELVDIAAVNRFFALLAIVSPILGLIIGAIAGARRGRAGKSALVGLLYGLLAVLNWVMWRSYNALTDRNGLDSVKNLFINLALFLIVGVSLGVGAAMLRGKFGVAPDADTAGGSKES